MSNNELLSYIRVTWQNLVEEGQSAMIRIENCPAPIFLRAGEQNLSFLITMPANEEADIKPKRYNNITITFEKLSLDTKGIVITLTNRRFEDVFSKIAADVIGNVMKLNHESEQISLFCNKVNSWKNVFSRGLANILSVEEQIGLYGELEFIKALIEEGFSTGTVIDAWKGADAEDKDFQFENIGIEIKSSAKQDNIVKISNIRQLDAAGYKELYLYYYSFAKSNGGLSTLPNQINSVRNILSGSPYLDEFEFKLLNVGYDDSDKEEYRASYTLVNENAYIINNAFPKITNELAMSGILDASYFVDLNICENNAISYSSLMTTLKKK